MALSAVEEARDIINNIKEDVKEYKGKITLTLIRAHMGNFGNERADQLAKEATLISGQGWVIKSVYQENIEYWLECDVDYLGFQTVADDGIIASDNDDRDSWVGEEELSDNDDRDTWVDEEELCDNDDRDSWVGEEELCDNDHADKGSFPLPSLPIEVVRTTRRM
ncbi:hypothetical protein AVEN_103091-1 [Araneus ventricosus]|uniref:RNase H type-1 domain-containing protein n=1 Tax=Araneus ventricosus TaxID=182803 RepID=A0A4Y2U4W9_ARAVE|nr:hypothetical protein AVEN_103091-1 [Araneus ventricosus]